MSVRPPARSDAYMPLGECARANGAWRGVLMRAGLVIESPGAATSRASRGRARDQAYVSFLEHRSFDALGYSYLIITRPLEIDQSVPPAAKAVCVAWPASARPDTDATPVMSSWRRTGGATRALIGSTRASSHRASSSWVGRQPQRRAHPHARPAGQLCARAD